MTEDIEVKSLEDICGEIVQIEEGLMTGEVGFASDNLMMAMGCCHPMEILDEILSEIFFDKENPEINLNAVRHVLKELKRFKSGFQVMELEKPIGEMAAYVKARENAQAAKQAASVVKPPFSLKIIRKKYIGKRFDPQQFMKGEDCWNLEVKNGSVNFHFYWQDTETEFDMEPTDKTYMDEVYIDYDDDMRIKAIEPLEANVEDEGDYAPCQASPKHYKRLDDLIAMTILPD